MTDAIVVLNAGSSSIKFALFEPANLGLLASGQVTSFNLPIDTHFEFSLSHQLEKQKSVLPEVINHQQAVHHILQWIKLSSHNWCLVAAGHRVVHGGEIRHQPVLINAKIMSELAALEPLAPQHQPHNLNAINIVSEILPELPQVACFDTAFHAIQHEVQRLLPLPEGLRDMGLMKYGFHGLSYEYLVEELPRINNGLLPEKLIIAHLGNGASICAINNGKSVSTSMGFSTLDGLVMGSRCGSIDPGVLLHILRTKVMGLDQLTSCLYEQCGLLGLSGLSSDMRELEASSSSQARLAIQVYINSFMKHFMALTSVLQGIDAIVFSGGVGENSVLIRQQILSQLAWLGCELDSDANRQGDSLISSSQSKIKAFVIPANEELIIARRTQQLAGYRDKPGITDFS